MDRTLQGQVAIVSGGLGDIGRAIVLELARRGADVAVGDVRPDRDAAGLLRKARALRGKARYDRTDVTDADAVERWVKEVEKHLGLPTLIVPNAGIVQPTRFIDLDPHQWRRELSVNLDGAFHLAQAATRRLRRCKKGGRVVFVGSWAGHVPHTHIPAYCVSKAGLRMLCRCMAAELAPHGILVNEVAPGYVDAGLSGRFFRKDPKLRRESQDSVPVGKLIRPEEVAVQVAWLCEPDNVHLAGTTLVMDGGLSLFGPGGMHQ